MHSMEEAFKVHLSIRRDTMILVSGEEVNVLRCVEALKDMGEEVETTMTVSYTHLTLPTIA